MKDQFRRILDLVRKTGDTMVVTDPDGEEVFVVMDIEQYEMLIGTEEDGIREEVASSEGRDADIWQIMKPAGTEGETWDLDQMNEEELADLEEQYRQFAQRNVKEVIDTTPETKEVPSSQPKTPDSDDFGEEAFYLEPVE